MIEILSSQIKAAVNNNIVDSNFYNTLDDEDIEQLVEQIAELIKSKGLPNNVKSGV